MTTTSFEVVIGEHVVELSTDQARALAHKLLDLVHANEDGWLEGEILSFCAATGYGFVRRLTGGDGIYFHVRNAPGFTDADFNKGRRVRFTVKEGFGRNAGKLAVGELRLA